MLDSTRTRESLRLLLEARAEVFGASGHHFLLNGVLDDKDILSFEQKHRVRLPLDYRNFLTAIGNGGAGPDYGVFPLGQMDGNGQSLKPWTEHDGFVGILSEPFPFSESWNDLSGKPSEELLDENESEYDRLVEEFDERYFSSSLVNGAIPICHRGCAIRIWLVITGVQSGFLWRDGRAELSGLNPLLLRDGSPATFTSWYEEWLRTALGQAGLAEV